MRTFFSPVQRGAHAAGLALGIGGIVILSPDSLLLRLLAENGAESAAVIAGRAAWTAAATAAMCALPNLFGRQIKWRPVFLYALFFAAGLTFFPLSIQRTYAANTLILLATTPMLAAVGARIFLGEKIAPQTWAAALAAGLGAGFLMAGETESGHLLGDFFALLVAVALAASGVLIRGNPELNALPGVALGGAITAVGWGFFAEWETVATFGNSLMLFVDGALVVGLSFALITLAARLLPPPETGLIFLLEAALGPLWVWMFLNERPPLSSALAGVFIAAVLVAHSVWALRQKNGGTVK